MTGAVATVSGAVVETEPTVAVMVTWPSAAPVAMPLELMEAMLELEELKVAPTTGPVTPLA